VRPEARDLCSCVRQSRNQWSVVTQIRHRVSMDMSFWLHLYCEVCEHTLDTAHVLIGRLHDAIGRLLNFVGLYVTSSLNRIL
jgi:hypothetical protein